MKSSAAHAATQQPQAQTTRASSGSVCTFASASSCRPGNCFAPTSLATKSLKPHPSAAMSAEFRASHSTHASTLSTASTHSQPPAHTLNRQHTLSTARAHPLNGAH
eukprot:2227523-Rhodomonas_salina.1